MFCWFLSPLFGNYKCTYYVYTSHHPLVESGTKTGLWTIALHIKDIELCTVVKNNNKIKFSYNDNRCMYCWLSPVHNIHYRLWGNDSDVSFDNLFCTNIPCWNCYIINLLCKNYSYIIVLFYISYLLFRPTVCSML